MKSIFVIIALLMSTYTQANSGDRVTVGPDDLYVSAINVSGQWMGTLTNKTEDLMVCEVHLISFSGAVDSEGNKVATVEGIVPVVAKPHSVSQYLTFGKAEHNIGGYECTPARLAQNEDEIYEHLLNGGHLLDGRVLDMIPDHQSF